MWRSALVAIALVLTTGPVRAQEQMGDPDFRPVVAHPAYAGQGPEVVLDEAHGSVQTADGRYAPFVALVQADGYRVRSGHRRFDAGGLDGVQLLVISNAASPVEDAEPVSAFTPIEIAVLEAWVRGGGSLLLAADHAPHGTAAEALATAFGVQVGKGYAFRLVEGRVTTQLTYSGVTLGDHPILQGRSAGERVRDVTAFTGQSLIGPPGSTTLLRMEAGDREAVDRDTLVRLRARLDDGEPEAAVLSELSVPVGGRAQGLAFTYGAGRVVVLGEAGMLTAQMIRFPEESGRPPLRFGMSVPGNQDQQFALNILHWLSGALD